MTVYATRLQNGTDTAVRMRMSDSLPLLSPGTIGGRSGFRNDGGAEVTVNAGAMTVVVSPFTAWVDGAASAAQAGYPVINDNAVSLTIAAGDATQARIDTIAVIVRDTAFDAGGTTSCTLEVVKGTPGGGAPALPVSSLPIRDITVPAGLSAGTGGLSTSNLSTDRRIYLPSGITRVASSTEANSLVVEAGSVVYRQDTDRLQVWNGTAWETYAPKTDTGWVNLPLASGYTEHSTPGTPKYRKIDDVVYLRGGVTNAGGSLPVDTSGSVVANLPAGYYPNASHQFMGVPQSPSTSFIRWFVQSDGRVLLYVHGAATQYAGMATTFPVGGG